MGGDLEPRVGDAISLDVHAAGCVDASVYFFVDGHASPQLPPLPITAPDQNLHAAWHAVQGRHFIRVEVHDHNDRLLLLGNPIYFGYRSESAH